MTSHVLYCLTLGFALSFVIVSPAEESTLSVKPVELHASNGGRVWVYMPSHAPADARLPCVLVPPAGSRLFHGMALGEGDKAEHLPYVDAGFAVVAFDISGACEDTSMDEMRKALHDFTVSRCGVNDAMEALQLALEKYPQIDPRRVFIAGHSSAATLALQVAASSQSVRACVAYAPVINIEHYIGSRNLEIIDTYSPGSAKILREMSPSSQVDALKCPVFLFHAEDDSKVTSASMLNYHDDILAHHKEINFVSVPTGGHYISMILEGIPQAITWLKQIDQKMDK